MVAIALVEVTLSGIGHLSAICGFEIPAPIALDVSVLPEHHSNGPSVEVEE
jgi:hypothetical protein